MNLERPALAGLFFAKLEMSVEAVCAIEGTACCACAASGKAAMPAIIAMKRRLRIGPYLCWVSLQLRTFKEEIQAAECLPWVCAVQRRRFPVGASPTRQPLQPEQSWR